MNTVEPPPAFRAFYRRLLKFYPRSFREQFGESMEQTFDDLCREENGRPGRMFSLTVSMSVDTGIGIVKERVLHFSKRSDMRNLLANSMATAVIGFLLALPGAMMLSMLMFNIEPPLGPLRQYVEGPKDGPHLFGSLIALTCIVVLPTIGLLINAGVIRKALLTYKNLFIATAAGLLLVMPFVGLELTYGQTSYSGFPWPLFGMLWLLATIFIAVVVPMVQSLLAGNGLRAHPATFVLGVLVLVITASMWVGIVNDQMPCFLGVPNCD